MKDPAPLPTKYNADICDYLATNPAPFRKFLEPFLCLVAISRYYTLDEGCYPTFWDDENEEMDLFAFINHADLTKVKIGEREVKEGKVPLLELTKERVVPLVGVNDQEGVVAQAVGNENVDEGSGGGAVAADQIGKRKIADGASGFGYPPKKLREDHGTFREVGASTAGKSLVALQDLLDKITLATEIANIKTKRPAERFVISLDTPHDSNANAANDEVSSVSKSTILDPVVLTTTIATTIVADTVDFTSAGNINPDVAGPSQPADNDMSSESFYVSLDMEFETLDQTYVPKCDVLNDSSLDEPNVCRSLVDQLAPPMFFTQLRAMDFNQLSTEFNVGAARQSCLGAEVRMQLEHVLRGGKRLEGKCDMQAKLLKERDTKVANLKAQLSLKEAETAEAIRLRGQIMNVEAAEAAKDDELNSIKASTLECEKDKLVDQVFVLEADCSGLHDEVLGYMLFKERIEEMHDAQVKALSDRVAGIDSKLLEMALYLDEEFYPCFLTTIDGRRWILSHDVKLVIVKCLQSPKYMAALGGAIGRAIDKGMQDRLMAGIKHGKAGRSPNVISAYNPAAEDIYVSAINALTMEFPLLAQLESLKDVSMMNIMDLLLLEGPIAEAPETSQLQLSLEQLMVPIHQLEYQAIIVRHLSLMDVIVPLVEPLSTKSLVGEASTSRVPITTTALSTTFSQVCIVPLVPSTNAPISPKIIFEQEELDTTPKHASAP
ncbi:hypothetical protein Tco_0700380 [Tanacetum coccineum]